MDFELFQRLGDAIFGVFRQANQDERKFPDIAAAALAAADLPEDFNIHEIASFLRTTCIPQQPNLRFSDLAPVVYRCDAFYIEMLIWTNSTTIIHQHSFAGAFRVLVGGSLHAKYAFTAKQRMSSLLLVGESHLRNLEELRPGHVRRIVPGADGLLHSLFHLVEPSVTLVVRTHTLPWARPQYALLRPRLLYAPLVLETDATVKLFGRAGAVALRIDPSEAVKLLLQQLPLLDFPRTFMITMQNLAMLQQESVLNDLVAAVRHRHGRLAEHLLELAQEEMREDAISGTRRVIVDPELRYFLALLLNAPSQQVIFEQLQGRFPNADPYELCARWLLRLSEEESAAQAFLDLAQKAQLGSYRLAGKLSRILPCRGTEPESVELIRGVLKGQPPEQILASLKARFDPKHIDAQSASIVQAYDDLKQLPELQPLMAQ